MHSRKHIILLGLLAVLTLTLSVLGCKADDSEPKPEHPLLLVSFDGFRSDYLERTETPHFDSLVARGVQAEGMIPVFPTKTFPNHYSIATGLYPEHTGLVGNTMYDPQFQEWYRISDRDAVENEKWYFGEPIWNTVEKQGLSAGTMFWVGSEAPIQDMRPTYWKPFDSSISERARIDTVVQWLSYPEGKKVDFGTLYFELVDNAGHWYGLDSDSLDMAIQKADSLVGYLQDKLVEAGLSDRLNLVVVSDHGMVDLSADKVIMLDSIINLDDTERIIWDPVTMIQPKEGNKEQIYRTLKDREEEGHYRVYLKEDLPERFHLKESRRVSDIILVADLGYTVLSRESKESFLERLPAGTHGYDNRDRAMRAFFAAQGPAFRKGTTVAPFQNIHIYELMNHLLGTEPAENDGSLDSVKVMLE